MEKIAEQPTGDKPVAVVKKNSREELRLSLAAYNGHEYADLRVYYLDDDSGDMRPSKKGITVPPDRWLAFRQGLDQLEAEMATRGLLRTEEVRG